MGSGDVSPNLPFAKKEGLEILKVNYRSREEAASKIPAAFAAFYQQNYPEIWASRRSEVTSSANGVLAIYDRNIFPEMNVTWGKYPINVGHTDSPGCFRCHDGSHNAPPARPSPRIATPAITCSRWMKPIPRS